MDDARKPEDRTPDRAHADGARVRTPAAASAASSASGGLELSGSLPCARCGYDLRGLSIRDQCSECGLPVRATLLTRVDPLAHELRPIRAPRWTAAGVGAWALGALGGALTVWVLRLIDLGAAPGLASAEVALAWTVLGWAVVSGAGAAALVAPHPGLRARHRWCAALGVALYAPLLVVLWAIHLRLDPTMPPAYSLRSSSMPPGAGRLTLHVAACALMGTILLCLRPNARALAARSYLLRLGRVDRQQMAAMVAILGLIAVGDVLLLLVHTSRGPGAEQLRQAGQLVVLVGSALLTLGLFSMARDCWRLRDVVLEPPLTASRILRRVPSLASGAGPAPDRAGGAGAAP